MPIQALQLEPSLGRHVLLSTRADVRLAAGDAVGALEDAAAAVLCAPPSFTAVAATQVRGVGIDCSLDGQLLLLAAPALKAHHCRPHR